MREWSSSVTKGDQIDDNIICNKLDTMILFTLAAKYFIKTSLLAKKTIYWNIHQQLESEFQAYKPCQHGNMILKQDN